MQVNLHQLSKRYKYDWVFKSIDFQFDAGGRYAITGPNGSGKSTLMKVLSGHLSPSKGEVVFSENGKPVSPDEVFQAVSYAAPYIDLIEEFTLQEAIAFHHRFKPLAVSPQEILDLLAFPKAREKQVRHFSSGMKQRLKLALAACSHSPLLLLDEPTSNLDHQGVDWYLQLMHRFLPGRTVVVASNIEVDYSFCSGGVRITDYK